jgi:hypothetical protein
MSLPDRRPPAIAKGRLQLAESVGASTTDGRLASDQKQPPAGLTPRAAGTNSYVKAILLTVSRPPRALPAPDQVPCRLPRSLPPLLRCAPASPRVALPGPCASSLPAAAHQIPLYLRRSRAPNRKVRAEMLRAAHSPITKFGASAGLVAAPPRKARRRRQRRPPA